MDQDETWHAGRRRAWPHCVRREPCSCPLKGHSPQFSAHICCGQMAGWIKMPLGMEVGLGAGDFVLDGDPTPPLQKGAEPPPPIFGPCLFNCGQMAGWVKMALGMEVGLCLCHIVLDWDPSPLPLRGTAPIFGLYLLWPNGWMDQDVTWYGDRPRPRRLCVRWLPSSRLPKKGRSPQFLAHVYCSQTAGWIKMTLGLEVGLGPGDVVLDGDPTYPKKGAQLPPIFGPCLLWPNGCMYQGTTW